MRNVNIRLLTHVMVPAIASVDQAFTNGLKCPSRALQRVTHTRRATDVGVGKSVKIHSLPLYETVSAD